MQKICQRSLPLHTLGALWVIHTGLRMRSFVTLDLGAAVVRQEHMTIKPISTVHLIDMFTATCKTFVYLKHIHISAALWDIFVKNVTLRLPCEDRYVPG